MEKKILIKSYDNEGNFKAAWNDAKFVSFEKELNGGLGECKIELARKFDDYGEYNDVALNNEIRIMVTDNDTQGTNNPYKLIYAGYINEYEPWAEQGKEGVSVYALGYYTKFAQDIYKNGTTTTITESSTDVGTMFRNLMDRYMAENSNSKMNYNAGSIRQTSTTASYIFEMMTYKEAIEAIKELSPANWWWYVDENHIVYFKDKPSSATHTFVFGRHFSRVKVRKGMNRLHNAVLFWNRRSDNSQIYKLYTDTASINEYGRRVIRKVNQDRVASESDADKIGNNYIEEFKNPHIQVEVEIIDNNENDFGYDIESIDPGDTCNFAGYDEVLDETFKENMLITKVKYYLDKAVIQLEPMRAGVVNRTESINKRVEEVQTAGAPEVYNSLSSSSSSSS